ncbi:MAG: hypothetical protein ACO1O1_11625 [Adhaeribacter sp.]
MKWKLFVLVPALAALSSCEELWNEDTTTPDGSVPFISVQSPQDNSVYSTQQQVKIRSEISDKDKIKQLEVHVTPVNAGSGDVWGYTKYPKKNPVIIDTTFSTAGLPAGDYIITLNTIDGRTNAGSKVIHFSVK